MLGISDAAESIGMHTQGVKITLEQLTEGEPLPCILHWNQNHFVVLYRITSAPKWREERGEQRFYIADPIAKGLPGARETTDRKSVV